MRQLCFKTICVWISLCILITGLQPSAFSAAQNISIPEKFGKAEWFQGKASNQAPPVYLILDAHDSLEAQENIAGIIEWLAEQKKIRLVLEEGFEGKVPTDDFFSAYKDPEKRKKISYLLMDRLRLGGAEFAHINRRASFELIGMDSDSAQAANLEAAALASRYQAPVLDEISRIESEIKNAVWEKLPKFVREMIENKRHGVDLGHMPEIYLKKLDEEWKGRRENLPQFAALMKAIRSHADSIPDLDMQLFLQELQKIESEVLKKNIPDQNRLELVKDWMSLIQLRRFALLEVSFEEYEALSGSLQGFRGFSLKAAEDLKQAGQKPRVFSKRWEFALENSVLFYEAAKQRDIYFRRALRAAAGRSGEESFAVVCGGFHRKELEQAIKKMGRSYAAVTPRMSEMSARHQKLYKKRLAQPYDDFEEKMLKAAAVSVRPRSAFQILSGVPGTFPERLEHYLQEMTAAENTAAPRAEIRRSEARTIDETGLDPLLESGKRTLLFSEQNEALADEIEARAAAAGRPAVYVRIQTQQDIERLLTMTRIEADGRVTVMRGELAEVLENGGVLIIDYAESMAQQAEGFNSAFDKNPYWRGFGGLENVTIIGLMHDARLLDYPNSLYSRFKEKLNFKFSKGFIPADPLQDRFIENNVLPEDSVSWDAFDNPYVDRELVRQYHFQNGSPAVEPGSLVQALQAQKPLVLHRAAMTPGTATFRFLREAFRRGYVVYNGEKIQIPADFRIHLSPQASAANAKNAVKTKLIVSRLNSGSEQKPVYIVHQDNIHTLSQSAEADPATGKLSVQSGLLASPESVKLRITTNLPRHVWNAVMGAGFDEVDVAPWVQIPAGFGGQVETADFAKEALPAKLFDPDALQNYGGVLIQGTDEDWIEAEIRQALPGRKIHVHIAGQETGLAEIQGAFIQTGPGQYAWNEGWGVIAALQRGEAVVIHRAHAAPGLLQALSTALAEQPYLMVNGKRVEWKKQGGILIVTDAGRNESERRENTRIAAHAYEAQPAAEALRQVLHQEFPSITDEAWESLQSLSSLFQKIPVPEMRAAGSAQLYPSSFSLDLKMMRMIARHFEKIRSWEKAIEEVVLSHYQDDPEIHDYMLVMTRLAMDAHEPAPLRTLNSMRLRELLNRSTPPVKWEAAYYWQAAAVMDAESLRRSGFQLTSFENQQADRSFPLIKNAIIAFDMRRETASAKNIENEHRHRFSMENDDVSDAPVFDGDWLEEEETETQMQRQLDIALRSLLLDGAVFLQGAPGVGKTYSAGKILGMLKEAGAAQGGLSADAQLYQMTAGPALRMRDFMKPGAAYSEWEKKGGVLFIDEANLADREFWSFLEEKIGTAAPGGEKRFVVFTGNQNYLPGRSRLRISEKMTVVQYAAMNDAFIREKILLPLIDLNIQKEEQEAPAHFDRRLENLKRAKADQIIRLHRLFERAAGANVYSARDLQELVLRMNRDADPAEGRPAWDEKRMVQTAWQIYSGHLSDLDAKTLPYILALWYPINPDHKKKEIAQPLNSEWQSLDFSGLVLTPGVREIADILTGFLKGRDQRIQSGDNREAGKFGFIQEGPSARLKDELVLTLLQLLGYSEKSSEPGRKFIRLTATPDNAEYIDAEIRHAREEGALVVLSEINLLPSSYIEGRLNDALTGANSKPGFALIGSMNTGDFSGRQKLSSALLNRVIYREVPAYTQDEIEQIASARLGSEFADAAKPLAAFHAWLRSRIEDASRHPTVRELNDAVDLIKQGQSVEDAIEAVYGLLFLEKMQLGGEYQTGAWRKTEEKERILAEHILQRAAGLIMPPEIGDPVLEITAGNTDYGGYRQKHGNIIRIKSESLRNDPFGVLFHEASHGIFTTNMLALAGDADNITQDLEDLRHLRAFDRFFQRAGLNHVDAYHGLWRDMFAALDAGTPAAQEEAVSKLQQYLLAQPETSERDLFQTTLIFFVMETFINSSDAAASKQWEGRIRLFGDVIEKNKQFLPGLKNNPFSAAAEYLQVSAEYAAAIPNTMRVEDIQLAQYLANQAIAGVQDRLAQTYSGLSNEPLLKAAKTEDEKKAPLSQAALEQEINEARGETDLAWYDRAAAIAPVHSSASVKDLEKQMRKVSGQSRWKEKSGLVFNAAAGLIRKHGLKTGLFLAAAALFYWLIRLDWSAGSFESLSQKSDLVLDHPAFPIVMLGAIVIAAIFVVWLSAGLLFPEAMERLEAGIQKRIMTGHGAHRRSEENKDSKESAVATFRVLPLERSRPKPAAVSERVLPEQAADLRQFAHDMDAQLDRLIGDFFARDASVAHVQGGSQINLEMLIQTAGNLEESYEQLGAQEKIDAREIVLFGDLPDQKMNPVLASFLDYLTERGFVFTIVRSQDEFLPGLRGKSQVFSGLAGIQTVSPEEVRSVLKNRPGGMGRALPIHIQDLQKRVQAQYLASAFLPLQDQPETWEAVSDALPAPGFQSSEAAGMVISPDTLEAEEKLMGDAAYFMGHTGISLNYSSERSNPNYWVLNISRPHGQAMTRRNLELINSVLLGLKNVTRLRAIRLGNLENLELPAFVNLETLVIHDTEAVDPWLWQVSPNLKNVMVMGAESFYRPPFEANRGVAVRMTDDEFFQSARAWISQHPNHAQLKVIRQEKDYFAAIGEYGQVEKEDSVDFSFGVNSGIIMRSLLHMGTVDEGVVRSFFFDPQMELQTKGFLMIKADLGQGEKFYTGSEYVKAVKGDKVVLLKPNVLDQANQPPKQSAAERDAILEQLRQANPEAHFKIGGDADSGFKVAVSWKNESNRGKLDLSRLEQVQGLIELILPSYLRSEDVMLRPLPEIQALIFSNPAVSPEFFDYFPNIKRLAATKVPSKMVVNQWLPRLKNLEVLDYTLGRGDSHGREALFAVAEQRPDLKIYSDGVPILAGRQNSIFAADGTERTAFQQISEMKKEFQAKYGEDASMWRDFDLSRGMNEVINFSLQSDKHLDYSQYGLITHIQAGSRSFDPSLVPQAVVINYDEADLDEIIRQTGKYVRRIRVKKLRGELDEEKLKHFIRNHPNKNFLTVSINGQHWSTQTGLLFRSSYVGASSIISTDPSQNRIVDDEDRQEPEASDEWTFEKQKNILDRWVLYTNEFHVSSAISYVVRGEGEDAYFDIQIKDSQYVSGQKQAQGELLDFPELEHLTRVRKIGISISELSNGDYKTLSRIPASRIEFDPKHVFVLPVHANVLLENSALRYLNIPMHLLATPWQNWNFMSSSSLEILEFTSLRAAGLSEEEEEYLKNYLKDLKDRKFIIQLQGQTIDDENNLGSVPFLLSQRKAAQQFLEANLGRELTQAENASAIDNDGFNPAAIPELHRSLQHWHLLNSVAWDFRIRVSPVELGDMSRLSLFKTAYTLILVDFETIDLERLEKFDRLLDLRFENTMPPLSDVVKLFEVHPNREFLTIKLPSGEKLDRYNYQRIMREWAETQAKTQKSKAEKHQKILTEIVKSLIDSKTAFMQARQLLAEQSPEAAAKFDEFAKTLGIFRSELKTAPQLSVKIPAAFDKSKPPVLFMLDAESLASADEMSPAVFDELLKMQAPGMPFKDHIRLAVAGAEAFLKTAAPEQSAFFEKRMNALRQMGFEIKDAERLNLKAQKSAIGFISRQNKQRISLPHRALSEFYEGAFGVALVFAQNPDTPSFRPDRDGFIFNSKLASVFAGILSQIVVSFSA